MKTILILDVATSGYFPNNDHILEVAAILVDARTLEVLDTTSIVIKHAEGDVKAPDFHSALVAECALSTSSIAAAEGELLAGPWTTADAICNRALDFDLRFLAAHMPTFHKALTRKLQIELKALEAVFVSSGLKAYVNPEPRTFRASDDAIAAYGEYVYYCDVLRGVVAS